MATDKQEMPGPGQQDVALALKERFVQWIDQRTAQGIETYGRALQTHNGRKAVVDMLQELLDFCQYQQQRLMELEATLELVENADGVDGFQEAMRAVHNAIDEAEAQRLMGSQDLDPVGLYEDVDYVEC